MSKFTHDNTTGFSDADLELRNAAAVLGKIGGASETPAKTQASRENGKLGGRPIYQVRHCYPNPANNRRVGASNLTDATEELASMTGDGCSDLTKNGEMIATRDWDKKRISWIK